MVASIEQGLKDASIDTKGNGTKTHADYLAERQPFYEKRLKLFEQFLQREQQKVDAAKAANVSIKVVMPDGAEKPAVKGVTTPMDIANAYTSKSFVKKIVVAEVDGQPWDLMRPLEADCALKLYTFSDPEGADAFWHSSAHVLGEALEQLYGVDLTVGPALEDGFYYDCFMGEGRSALSESEHKVVEKKMEAIAKEAQPFQRVEVSRDEAVQMFQENKFKIEILNEMIKPDARISIYRCGPMVDMCRGPHLPNTAFLKALAVTQASRSHWRGDVAKEGLQRVYGVTFPESKLLKEHMHRIEEAKKRDHRLLGQQHELFFFHQLSPGSCFFLPHGARVYNALVNFIKEKYWEYEYEEVMTPNMFNFELWKTSGHADHYKANMFSFMVESGAAPQEFGLKPMNCPAHCVMFANRTRSYRELPLRLADFGVLHRNEYSGALHGLTRVRKFSQDDAHIFCTRAQVEGEVTAFLRMLDEVYGVFGLDYTMALSTRPEGYLGELAVWDEAEKALTDALNSTGKEWKLDPGEGAFYGPKIDITVYDALRRKFQCATVQLDFQLPIRFKLEYRSESQTDERPVIVHRAVLGSVERMFAILTEHFAGKWPLWLSPRQVKMVPISQAAYEYAKECARVLRAAGFYVDVDLRDDKMQKKVREAQIAQVNYILVVGEKEQAERTVNVRTRDNVVHGMHTLDAVLDVLKRERQSRSKLSLFGHADEAAAAAAADAAAAAPPKPKDAA